MHWEAAIKSTCWCIQWVSRASLKRRYLKRTHCVLNGLNENIDASPNPVTLFYIGLGFVLRVVGLDEFHFPFSSPFSSMISGPCVFPKLNSSWACLQCTCWLFQCSSSVSSGPVEACTVQASDPGSASTPPSWEVQCERGRHSCSANVVGVVISECERF